MWYSREISEKIISLSSQFPAIILTGARQTGKTSLLKSLFPKHNYVSLDIPQRAELAESSPERFLAQYKAPLIVDEVQYAPKLFRHLKSTIDSNRHTMGQFILTGSQKFVLMREVSDSLAGRCAILELETLSLAEIEMSNPTMTADIYKTITRGGFPDLWRDPKIPHSVFYDSYLSTYLERDVRQILNISSLRDFDRFLRVCATRTGQILDKSSLASDLGISTKAINSWLSVLEASNQIVLLEPWYTNIGKRIIKSPKLYFSDTGLACYLLGLEASDLISTPYLGALWETLVFAELRKTFQAQVSKKSIWLYRDNSAKEIDFMIQTSGKIDLIECKFTEQPKFSDSKTMQQIESHSNKHSLPGFQIRNRLIVCRTPVAYEMDNGTKVIPLSELVHHYSS